MKTAREAWGRVKTVDSMVTLFHCAVRHELKYSSCDTMLELDSALNELMSTSHDPGVDEILDAFPRLSNSCVECNADGGETLLLGLQERWVSLLVSSNTLCQFLKDKSTTSEPPGGHSVFEVLRAYLENFEHLLSAEKGKNKLSHCEALIRILDGTLKQLKQVREQKQQRALGRRKKKTKVESETKKDKLESETGFILIWDDLATKKLIGTQADCVWVAEQ